MIIIVKVIIVISIINEKCFSYVFFLKKLGCEIKFLTQSDEIVSESHQIVTEFDEIRSRTQVLMLMDGCLNEEK